MRTILMLAVGVSVTIGAAPQQQPVSGTWSVKGEAASGRNDSGGTWSRSAVTGILEIAEKDGALTGTWTPTKRPPLKFTGQLEGAAFEFEAEPRDVAADVNGVPSTLRMRWTFVGVSKDGQLQGTMSLDKVDDPPDQPQPFTAERVKERSLSSRPLRLDSGTHASRARATARVLEGARQDGNCRLHTCSYRMAIRASLLTEAAVKDGPMSRACLHG